MQINIPQTHQRHSILLNIFPLRRWRERGGSSQQSRKSQRDSSIGNNGQNQRRSPENRRYLVFVLRGDSCILFSYYHTLWFSGSVASKSSSSQQTNSCYRQGSQASHLSLILSINILIFIGFDICPLRLYSPTIRQFVVKLLKVSSNL